MIPPPMEGLYAEQSDQSECRMDFITMELELLYVIKGKEIRKKQQGEIKRKCRYMGRTIKRLMKKNVQVCEQSCCDYKRAAVVKLRLSKPRGLC